MLGQPPIGGDFTAKDVQHRRATGGIDLQRIVAGRSRRRTCAVIIKRAHAGVAPHDIRRGDRLFEILRGKGTKIVLLLGRADRLDRGIGLFGICGADQGKIGLIGNGENDAPVSALKEIAFIVIEQLFRHDMAAAHQTHAFG